MALKEDQKTIDENYDMLVLISDDDYSDCIAGDPDEEGEWELVINQSTDTKYWRYIPALAYLDENGERLSEEEHATKYKMSLDVISFVECCYSPKWSDGFDYYELWEACMSDGSIDGDEVDVDRLSQMIKARHYWMGDNGGYVVMTDKYIADKKADDKSFEDYKKEYYPPSTQQPQTVVNEPDVDTVKLTKLVEDATKFEPLAAGTKCYYKVTDTEDMVNGIYVEDNLEDLRIMLVDTYGTDDLYDIEDIELTVDQIIPDKHSNITVIYYDNECETVEDAASATLNTLEEAELFIDGRCGAWGGHCSVIRVVIKDGDKIKSRLPSNNYFSRAYHLDHFEIMLNRVISSPQYLKVIGCKNAEEAEAKVSEEEFIELIRTGKYPVIKGEAKEPSLEIKEAEVAEVFKRGLAESTSAKLTPDEWSEFSELIREAGDNANWFEDAIHHYVLNQGFTDKSISKFEEIYRSTPKEELGLTEMPSHSDFISYCKQALLELISKEGYLLDDKKFDFLQPYYMLLREEGDPFNACKKLVTFVESHPEQHSLRKRFAAFMLDTTDYGMQHDSYLSFKEPIWSTIKNYIIDNEEINTFFYEHYRPFHGTIECADWVDKVATLLENPEVIEIAGKIGVTIIPRSEGQTIEPLMEEAQNNSVSIEFTGKRVCVTGKLSQTRKEVEALLEAAGATIASGVSKTTDYLIAGEDAGSKLAKAQELGVSVLTEDEMIGVLDQVDDATEPVLSLSPEQKKDYFHKLANLEEGEAHAFAAYAYALTGKFPHGIDKEIKELGEMWCHHDFAPLTPDQFVELSHEFCSDSNGWTQSLLKAETTEQQRKFFEASEGLYERDYFDFDIARADFVKANPEWKEALWLYYFENEDIREECWHHIFGNKVLVKLFQDEITRDAAEMIGPIFMETGGDTPSEQELADAPQELAMRLKEIFRKDILFVGKISDEEWPIFCEMVHSAGKDPDAFGYVLGQYLLNEKFTDKMIEKLKKIHASTSSEELDISAMPSQTDFIEYCKKAVPEYIQSDDGYSYQVGNEYFDFLHLYFHIDAYTDEDLAKQLLAFAQRHADQPHIMERFTSFMLNSTESGIGENFYLSLKEPFWSAIKPYFLDSKMVGCFTGFQDELFCDEMSPEDAELFEQPSVLETFAKAGVTIHVRKSKS